MFTTLNPPFLAMISGAEAKELQAEDRRADWGVTQPHDDRQGPGTGRSRAHPEQPDETQRETVHLCLRRR